jgi:hypothetical protein
MTQATPAGSVVTTMSRLRPVTLRAEDAISRTLLGDRCGSVNRDRRKSLDVDDFVAEFGLRRVDLRN